MKRPNDDTRIALAMDIINWNALHAYDVGENAAGDLLRAAWDALYEAACLLAAGEADRDWEGD